MTRCRRFPNYEIDPVAFPAAAYSVDGYAGVAWRVDGWHTEPDEDTEWSGYEERTGDVVCHMIGDDCAHVFAPGDLTPLGELDYCAECGQIGCTHDGRDRDDDSDDSDDVCAICGFPELAHSPVTEHAFKVRDHAE